MIKVMIDAGHGGKDPGAVGNGLKEKDIVLNVAKLVEVELDRCGFDARLVRSNDTFYELNERARLANNWKANAFVSIHCNAATAAAYGMETFAYSAGTAKLAKDIHGELLNDKALYRRDRGVKYANYAVLRETNMAAALVELAFISNTEDAKILRDKQKQYAVAIAKGVCKYFGVTYKAPTAPKPPVAQEINNGKTFSSIGKGTIQVVTGVLNVRADAGTDNKVVGQLKKGQKVKTLGSKEGWYKIANGQYVSGNKAYVKFLG